MIFQERLLKVLKRYNFLWVQRRHNCSPAASFADCIMTLYPLKVHLQTFLSIPVTQKCQILSYDTLVASERFVFWEYTVFPSSVDAFRHQLSPQNNCTFHHRKITLYKTHEGSYGTGLSAGSVIWRAKCCKILAWVNEVFGTMDVCVRLPHRVCVVEIPQTPLASLTSCSSSSHVYRTHVCVICRMITKQAMECVGLLFG